MARNTEKNAYWYVGIPRGSATHARLVQDALDKGVSVATLIAIRIDDFYKFGMPALQVSNEVPHAPSPEGESTVDEFDQEEANALAALDAWD